MIILITKKNLVYIIVFLLFLQDVYRAIIAQEIGFFDVTRTGELTNRLSADTAVVQSAVTESLPNLVRYVAEITGSLVIIFSISWQLTLVMLAVVPPVCIVAVLYGKVRFSILFTVGKISDLIPCFLIYFTPI